MEARVVPSDCGPIATAPPAGRGDAVGFAGTASPETGGRVRTRLVAGWHFTRHLLEMVVAMFAGMAALGLALGALGEPPGYANPFVEHGLMGAALAAPMVAWMRHRGHAWSDGLEMTGAMLVSAFALILLAEWGTARSSLGLSRHSLVMLSHAAMIAGMAALMVYRRDRYAHGLRGHRA